MNLLVKQSSTSGRVRIPGSKSHTIRALFLATLATGESQIIQPLISSDALSAATTCRALGAAVELKEGQFLVRGCGGTLTGTQEPIDVGNSGTTLRFGVAAASLIDGETTFTGDYQIRRRPLRPLLAALNNLGATVVSLKGNDMAPVRVKGKARGGRTELDAVSSQYLSALLISAPLFATDTEIVLSRLNEIPYVEMTLWWLDRQGIKYRNNNFKSFEICGGQSYRPFQTTIPGDFSSATFFMVLAAISGGEFLLENLDPTDPQGDKEVLTILESMGAKVQYEAKGIRIKGASLAGREIDLNAIPDALPALAVAGCFASGETRLVNVPQARLKETDRIRVMCEELSKMGANIRELPDGLIINESKLKGSRVNGHDDHRVVMALTVAGLNIEGETVIETAEAMRVTFPEFVSLITTCGGTVEWLD